MFGGKHVLCGWCVLMMLAGGCFGGEPENLGPLLETIRHRHDLPALAAAVVKADRITAIGAVGVRKAGDSASVTVEDKFHIGSCTKSMTATVAAMLVEKGRLSWQTRVGDVFPETMAPYRDVTLEQLLAHRGGVPHKPDPAAWGQAWRMRGTPTEQRLVFVRATLLNPPEAPPGTKYIYSNQGYAIAGAMLEKIAGKPYEALMCEMLFEPLGLKSAGFGAPATPGATDQPWGHVLEDGKLKPIPPGPRADNPPAISPAGRVHCAIGDLAKYAAFHLHREPAWMAKLHTPLPGQEYALGWGVVQRGWAGGEALNHNGCNTMFYAVMWLAPKRDFAVVVATNLGNGPAAKACDEVASRLVGRAASP